ncbi:MAG: 3-dehydroquinate synthase [Candidatus Omnitrophica bacterium 4484_70.1]|nr:MAG: 3-dehydroquinate synthase [Candidatus Omnitrophica bacterium 4484_70.1]
MEIIKVNLVEASYKIYIEKNLMKKIPSYIKETNAGNFSIILTTIKIYSLYKKYIKQTFKSLPHKVIPLVDGERAKSKECFFRVIEKIMKIDDIKRRIYIISLGGGVIGDLGGFVASLYKRGIPYFQIPTTFLAQIDASIGGKTAINLKKAKNIIGTFHQPKAVFIDPLFLTTLTSKQIKEGLAEVIKYSVIKDEKLFSLLIDNSQKILKLDMDVILPIISHCARIKARIVEKDEKERKGIRTILNFGHTIGHALETMLKYKKLTHGEAVSLGMICEGYISYYLNQCRKEDLQKLIKIIEIFSLPTKVSFDYSDFFQAMKYDKKFIYGGIRMVIFKKIGEVEVRKDIPLKIVKRGLRKIAF